MTAKAIPIITLAAATLLTGPAFAHHVMDGSLPATFTDGLLSGLGHPVIGLDHFAAVVAVGCLAAAHRAGTALAIGFVLAMIAGVAGHLQGASVPSAEILVAGSVIVLGAVLLAHRQLNALAALGLFAVVGLLHGYALGESIFGAEQTPLAAYLIGLAAIQSAIALAAMRIARLVTDANAMRLRLVGAGIAGIGIAILMQQVVPSV
ncbi:MAG: HupE/UreJ family protein [Pseudolabrys sp.]|nr:HupE/UreJ family protein [Pseudolabrys sp.]MDP2298381.1 HupE/UreJ family protein [Pseudolabrys sp.]